jgi:hypothetical protein
LFENIKGITNDDMISLAVDDDYMFIIGEMFRRGSANNILIKNIFADNCWRVVRLMASSTNSINNVTIDGIKGSAFKESPIVIDSLWSNASFGTIKINDVDSTDTNVSVIRTSECGPGHPGYTTHIKNLIVSNVVCNSDYVIEGYNETNIDNLIVSNVVLNGGALLNNIQATKFTTSNVIE